MKTVRLLSLLAIVVSMTLACQNDVLDVTAPPKSFNHNSAREATDCDCDDAYDPLDKVIFKSGDPEITVEVYNNGTTVYYYLHRTDNLQIGNLFVDGNAQGGSNLNFYNFTKPVGTLQGCGEQTTALKVVGATGPPIEFTIVYKIVALCIPPTACTAYTYDTGMGGPTAGGGKAWWYYYPVGSGVQTIWAGQTKNAGTVVIDAAGNYTIVLAAGWELKTGVTEPIKIQGYAAGALPTTRPSAGLFSGPSSYKGTSLTGFVSPVGITNYVIHLDLQKCAI